MPKHSSITAGELAELLTDTGHHHHAAFADTDGGDPEWATWYAAYLQTQLWDRAGQLPTRSRLTHLLVEADDRHRAAQGTQSWQEFAADFMLLRLSTSSG